MIFPIPKKETYSDGRYAVSAALVALSLVDLFAAVKAGKTEVVIGADSALSGEAHRISIGDSGVKIAYATEEGLFRAVTSLWQLLRKNGADLPYAEIEDAPTLARRGYMLDISRGRMPKVETIRGYINAMNPTCELEVDGGVDTATAPLCVHSGANVLVAGSAVYKAADIEAKIKELRG